MRVLPAINVLGVDNFAVLTCNEDATPFLNATIEALLGLFVPSGSIPIHMELQ
jgi:hypothetical protein